MEFFNNYLNNLSQQPKEYYRSTNQATIDDLWYDTDRLYNIKSQQGLPFSGTFIEEEAWLSPVSEVTVNLNRNISDFIRVLYRDIDHEMNFKGQYYKISLDGAHEDTYICYDKMNPLSQVADFKVCRCNNYLTWIDKADKTIHKLPCYIGYDIASTNNQYAKSGTIPNARLVIYVQGNDFTNGISPNDRFLFQHKTAYKVEQVENYELEQFADNEEVTFVKLYIALSAILPTDNLELNICDYLDYDYSVVIDGGDLIEKENGFTGKLKANAYCNNEIMEDAKLVWHTEDTNVVKLEEDGTFTVIGDVGTEANISCHIENLPTVADNVTIKVIESEIGVDNYVLEVYPNSSEEEVYLYQEDDITFKARVYKNGIQTDEPISCVGNWVNDSEYTLELTSDGYKLTNIGGNEKDLTLTFSSEHTEPVEVKLVLGGAF
jgi:hypothetical protein